MFDAGTFKEQQHPRGGNPENAGEFSKGSGGGGEHKTTGPTLKPTKQRAWTGRQQSGKRLGKQEAGALGEKVALQYIRDHLKLDDAKPLNMEAANFPVDLIGDHQLFEIKTGQVTNSTAAQQWRATIGQPGKEEMAWLATASAADKAAHNQAKRDAIMQRKKAVLADYAKKLGKPVKAQTVTLILNPDKATADIFVFDGFHHRIGYNSPEAKHGYVGSFAYERPGAGDRPARDRGRARPLGSLVPVRAGRFLFWLH